MRWSKLRQVIEEGFAPTISSRVRLLATCYRGAHDDEGRWAVVVDGNEVAGLGCIVADQEESALIAEVAGEWHVAPSEAQPHADEKLCAKAHHTLPMFMGALLQFTNMGIEDAHSSSDALLRALAALDRRTGKRRLVQLAQRRPATELERHCLKLRLQAEGIEHNW